MLLSGAKFALYLAERKAPMHGSYGRSANSLHHAFARRKQNWQDKSRTRTCSRALSVRSAAARIRRCRELLDRRSGMTFADGSGILERVANPSATRARCLHQLL